VVHQSLVEKSLFLCPQLYVCEWMNEERIFNLISFYLFWKDNYLEEAMKMRNLLEEFHANHGLRPPSILGVREHVFTGRLASTYYKLDKQSDTIKLWLPYLAYILLGSYGCSVSSLAWFMSNQETSFVTLAQRVLANPLK